MNISTKTNFLALILLITLLFSAAIFARPELGPPSIKLKSTISNITVFKLVAKDGKGLTFTKVKDLHNDAPNKVIIQPNSVSDLSLKLNQNYIVGYIAHKTLKPSKAVIPRPGGPVLMNLAGASPTLFTDDENIRRVFMFDVEESLTSPPELLNIILSGLNHPDPHSRSFFIAELVTRPVYLQQQSVQDAIKALVLQPDLSWSDKRLIIAFGGLNKSQLSAPWFCQWSASTLQFSSTQFDVHASEMGLIKSLLENSSNCTQTINFNTLSRWLDTNHAGIIEATINELRKIDLSATQKLVTEKINKTHLLDELRATLKNYLRRLNNEIKQQQTATINYNKKEASS